MIQSAIFVLGLTECVQHSTAITAPEGQSRQTAMIAHLATIRSQVGSDSDDDNDDDWKTGGWDPDLPTPKPPSGLVDKSMFLPGGTPETSASSTPELPRSPSPEPPKDDGIGEDEIAKRRKALENLFGGSSANTQERVAPPSPAIQKRTSVTEFVPPPPPPPPASPTVSLWKEPEEDLQAQLAEEERIRKEEADRLALEQKQADEAERLRLAKEQEEADRLAYALEQADEALRLRLAADEAERVRLAKEKEEADRRAAQLSTGSASEASTGSKAGQWRELYDAKRNRFYYNNSATGASQWERPADFVRSAPVQPARAPAVQKDGWVEKKMKRLAGGRTYYHNLTTGAMQFERPGPKKACSLTNHRALRW